MLKNIKIGEENIADREKIHRLSIQRRARLTKVSRPVFYSSGPKQME